MMPVEQSNPGERNHMERCRIAVTRQVICLNPFQCIWTRVKWERLGRDTARNPPAWLCT